MSKRLSIKNALSSFDLDIDSDAPAIAHLQNEILEKKSPSTINTKKKNQPSLANPNTGNKEDKNKQVIIKESEPIENQIPEQIRNESGTNPEQKEIDNLKTQTSGSKKTNRIIPEQIRNESGTNSEQKKTDESTTQTQEDSSKTIENLIPEQIRNESGTNPEQKETYKFKYQPSYSKKTNSLIPEQMRNESGTNPEQKEIDNLETQTSGSEKTNILIPEQMENESRTTTGQKETNKFKPQPTGSKKTNSLIPEQIRNKSGITTEQKENESLRNHAQNHEHKKTDALIPEQMRNKPGINAEQIRAIKENNIAMRNNSRTNEEPYEEQFRINSGINAEQFRNKNDALKKPDPHSPNIQTLPENERLILNGIYNICTNTGERTTPPFKYSYLALVLDLKNGEVVRKTISRMITKGFLKKDLSKPGRSGFVSIEIPIYIYKEISLLKPASGINAEQMRNNSGTIPGTISGTAPPSSSISFNNINKELTTNDVAFNPANVPGQQQLGPQFDSDWQTIDITPLASIGFSNNHLSQLFTKNELKPKQVQESINAFAFDLEENKRGEKIKTSPLNLFMGILKGGSPYNPPKNYESDEDRLLREQVEAEREKLEKRQQLQSELKDLKYQNWLLDLSIEKKLEILDVPQAFFEKMPIEAIQEGLKKHFEMKVL